MVRFVIVTEHAGCSLEGGSETSGRESCGCLPGERRGGTVLGQGNEVGKRGAQMRFPAGRATL